MPTWNKVITSGSNAAVNSISGSSFVYSGGDVIAQQSLKSIGGILTLIPQDPLPTEPPTGSFAVSSSTPPIPYFWDGTTWNALY